MTYFLALFKMENGSKDLQEYPLIIIEYHEKNIKEVQTQKLNTQMSHAPTLGDRIKSHFSNNVQQKIIHPIQIKCNLKKKKLIVHPVPISYF